jgi:ribosomal protein L37AE/L43A
LTKSHLEVISIMPTEEIMNDLAWQVIKSNDTVSDTERKAHRMRHEYEERMDLEEAVDKAQMKVCPFCGKEPARHDDGILCCSKWSFDGHKWSVDQSLEDWTSEQTRIADHKPKEEKEAEKEPTWFKSPLTKEQVNDAVSGYALKVLKMLDSVDNLKVIGSLSGEPITMELETRWKRNDFLLEVGGEGNPWEEETYVPPSHSFAMGWEEHTWKLATEMKTRIERAFKMAEGEDALHRIEAFIKGEYDPLKEKEG